MINITSNDTTDIVIGNTPVEKVYLESQLVWEKSAPGPVLPYDAELTYLYSSGSGQYIDTGIAYDSTVEIEASISLTGSATGNYIFGIYTTVGGTAQRWALQCYSRTAVRPHFGTVTNVSASFSRGLGTYHTVHADYRYLTVDNTVTDSKAAAFTPEHDVNIYLYARSDDNVAAVHRVCYIAWFKIWKNGVLVRDYIPVRDTDNVGYMYDKVSQTLFGNAGTGSFTCGPDVT